MPDYKELYQQLFHATEDAIEILVKAQQDFEDKDVEECEEEETGR